MPLTLKSPLHHRTKTNPGCSDLRRRARGRPARSQQPSGTDGVEGGEDRSHQLPRPPHSLSNKTNANSAAPTSERQESGQRQAVHPAPRGSLRLPEGSSRGGGGGGRSSRGSRVPSLPRTQHLERRTAPRLIPMAPPPVRRHSQWRPGPRLGGRPLGGSFPSPFGSARGFLGLSVKTTSLRDRLRFRTAFWNL